MVAEFHKHTDVTNKEDIYATPEQIYLPIKENFIQLQKLLSYDTAIAQLTVLES